MNTGQTPPDARGDAADSRAFPPLLVVLVALLAAEALLMIGLAVWLLLELLTSKAASYSSGVAILVLAVIGAIWVSATAVGAARRRPWIRGAAVTWQLVLVAVAVGCFQGFYAEPALGWALLAPAVVGVLLVLSPQVTRVTKRAS